MTRCKARVIQLVLLIKRNLFKNENYFYHSSVFSEKIEEFETHPRQPNFIENSSRKVIAICLQIKTKEDET